MHKIIPKSVSDLIGQFSELPGIGPKTASRLTFYLLHRSDQEVKDLGDAVINLKEKIKNCPKCFNITDQELCTICSDKSRDQGKILVVESPLDIIAIEKTQEYNGLYHVLGGAISPVDGIGPEDIKIQQLLERIKKDKISEVILATNPDLEGEATAMYIQKQMTNLKSQIPKMPKITRIARGIPIGGDLEYADEITLSKALEGRKEY
jgi:recombination protein RecR